MKFDKLDEEIVNVLIENSKTPLRVLASKLRVSFVTIMNRIKNLEKQGVIQKYTARINYEKLGYGTHVLVEIKIAKGKLILLEKKIARNPNIYAVYDTTGQFDTTIIGWFKSNRIMDSFLKKIQTYDFVESTNTKLILNTIKEERMKL